MPPHPPPPPRPLPFELVFRELARSRFPAIRQSLATAGLDPHDRDAFVLDREAVSLLRELVPDEAAGAEMVSQHLALLHHAFLFWLEGSWTFRLTRQAARDLLEQGHPAPAGAPAGAPRAYYIQFPERLVWARLLPGEPPEPLDGFFLQPWPDGGFFVLGIFGLHPGRDGFSVAEVEGYPEPDLVRQGGEPLFAPDLPGGRESGLHSLAGEEEILELAARTVPAVTGAIGGQPRDAFDEVIELG